MTKEERIEQLEKEIIDISEKIKVLEDLLNKKTSDYENEAKLSAEQASEFKESSEEAKNVIIQNLDEANSKLEELRITYASSETLSLEIQKNAESAKQNSELTITLYDDLDAKHESIQNGIAEIEAIIERKPAIDEKMEELEEVFTRADDFDSKINGLHSSSADAKKQIDGLYYEINGYTQKDEEGKETKVSGLKDKLQISYDELKLKLENTEKDLVTLKTSTSTDYITFVAEKGAAFDESLTNWQGTFFSIQKTIEGLLPNALTAGLSSAYSEKKKAEERENNTYSRTFYIAIIGMILISLIPFGISLNSLANKEALEQVILRIPRLVLAILPLYIPVLWVAYSSNRKMNLSKRLIEEYSHKEVLSKTFEGLSKQISSVEDKDVSKDLRNRLLYNILEVNSENPGKLISDYNKSDHPLMDALDKSVKLTNAVTKLANVPGVGKLLTIMEKKAEANLSKEGKKAEEGLEIVEAGKKKEKKEKKEEEEEA